MPEFCGLSMGLEGDQAIRDALRTSAQIKWLE